MMTMLRSGSFLANACLILMGTILMGGCVQAPRKEPVRLGALVDDSLTDGTTSGIQKHGTFTRDGWVSGPDGMLMYDLPGMSQGIIEFDVTGLTRTDAASVFVTLYEPGPYDFPTPYILDNPYRITLNAKPFAIAPESTFDWLWTSKAFPQNTPDEVIYSDEMPESNTYVEVVASEEAALYPGETHQIRMEWGQGVARLYLDGDLIAEHDYQPVVFGPDSLRIVFGRSPGGMPIYYETLTFSNIFIDYPGV